jgi:hypothetical protein
MATRPKGKLSIHVRDGDETYRYQESVALYMGEVYDEVMENRARKIINEGLFVHQFDNRIFYAPSRILKVTWGKDEK